MSVVIRAATQADRSVLVAFHHALYAVHRQAMVPEAEQALSAYRDLATVLRQDVDAILNRPTSLALLAEGPLGPVGYITGRVEDEPRRVLPKKGIVEDWYVEPEARGAGAGQQLFEAILAAFRERGCVVAESTTWPGNDPANNAHRGIGFVPVELKYRKRL